MLTVQHCETLCSKCDVILTYFFHSFLLLICVWRCLKAEITTRFVIRQNNNKMFWNSRFFNRFLEAWSGLDFIASTMKQVRSFQFREYKSKVEVFQYICHVNLFQFIRSAWYFSRVWNFKKRSKIWVAKKQGAKNRTQCPRTDLNKRFLSRPKTITA